jgi:hypothetical protein
MRRSPLYIKSNLPAGRSGGWSFEKFSVQPPGRNDSRPKCFQSPAGTYTRLKDGNEVFMTDLFDEWWTQRIAVEQAGVRGGDVLITGLGLGLVVTSMLEFPENRVERLIVIERSADVISLVAPSLENRYNGRIEIINADAFEWLPPSGQRFTVGWHDIWPNPHEPGLLAQTEGLEQRYAPYCAWQGNWIREYHAAEQKSDHVYN